ncbi:MAG TPA: cytochrome c maturation protein CcmE, partial [Candidatus Dormibacteraeota bacterium]
GAGALRFWQWGGLGLVVAACTAYLVYSATATSAEYYQTIPEVRAHPAQGEVRVLGTVADDVERLPGDEVRFTATDHGQSLPVEYTGALPDIFKPGIQVVVEGSQGKDGVFHARTLLAKCPSRFTAASPIAK